MFTPIRAVLGIAALATAVTGLAINVRSTPAPAPRTYVGEQTCMQSGCHEGQTGSGEIYKGAAAFRETMHQKIHLRPSPETVVIDKYFAGDSVLTTRVDRSNVSDTLQISLSKGVSETGGAMQYYAQMKLLRSGDTTPKLKIEYTYGGNGWIQRYLVQINGHYCVLPFQYALPAYRERTDTSNMFYFLDVDRWMDGDPNSGVMSFYKFNSNIFRGKAWDVACAPCHINGFGLKIDITPNPDDGTKLDTSYTVQWAGKDVDSAQRDINVNIGCESCHGPGSEHSANPTRENIVSPIRFGNTVAGTDLKLDLCNQCHNRMRSTANHFVYPYDETNNQAYTPGLPLKDFAYKGDIFYGATMWPDSSSRAHHQQGQDFARSAEYRKHVFQDGCWSCHTVHYQTQYPYQLDRNWYSLKSGEGCLTSGCHDTFDQTEFRPEAGEVVNKHTKHLQSVSQCVNCHFTKTATIAFIDGPRKPYNEFSAHTFQVIKPVLTLKKPFPIGQINTCAEACHRNGRGSRNFADSLPAAPTFGTHDNYVFQWNDNADIALADSLWQHYQQMFGTAGAVESSVAAERTAIASVFPNPVRTSTTVRFGLATRSPKVSLEVYDINGTYVRFLAGGAHEAGSYSVEWDGRDEMQNPVPAGTYIVRLTTGSGISTQKIVVTR